MQPKVLKRAPASYIELRSLPTLGIDEGDFAEVYDHGLLQQEVVFQRASFVQFVPEGLGQPSFQVQRGRICGVVNGDFSIVQSHDPLYDVGR